MTAIEKVTHLMFEAEALELSMPPDMHHAHLLDISAVWNGIGPAWAPEWLREALSSRLKCFQPAALIHDYAYSLIDRNLPYAEDHRRAADEQFYSNCRICAAHEAQWYSPVRWALGYEAFLAWRCVRRLGGPSVD